MHTIFKLSLAKLQSLHFQVLSGPMLLFRERSGLFCIITRLTASESFMSLKSFLVDFSSLMLLIDSWTGALLTESLLADPQMEQIFTSIVCLLKHTMHVHLDMEPSGNKRNELKERFVVSARFNLLAKDKIRIGFVKYLF